MEVEFPQLVLFDQRLEPLAKAGDGEQGGQQNQTRGREGVVTDNSSISMSTTCLRGLSFSSW